MSRISYNLNFNEIYKEMRHRNVCTNRVFKSQCIFDMKLPGAHANSIARKKSVQ